MTSSACINNIRPPPYWLVEERSGCGFGLEYESSGYCSRRRSSCTEVEVALTLQQQHKQTEKNGEKIEVQQRASSFSGQLTGLTTPWIMVTWTNENFHKHHKNLYLWNLNSWIFSHSFSFIGLHSISLDFHSKTFTSVFTCKFHS